MNTQNTERYYYEPMNASTSVLEPQQGYAVKLLFKTTTGRLMESKPFTAFEQIITCKRIQIENGLTLVKAIAVKVN